METQTREQQWSEEIKRENTLSKTTSTILFIAGCVITLLGVIVVMSSGLSNLPSVASGLILIGVSKLLDIVQTMYANATKK